MRAAFGVLAAAVVAGVAATVAYGLSTGFDRAAARADLPDVVARFESRALADLDPRVAALPNLAARSYRYEETRWPLRAGNESTRQGVVHVVLGGRRGYAIVAGRDLRGPAAGDVVIERGLADAWHLAPGDRLELARFGALRIAGVAVSPDNVAFPLAKTARVYVTPAAVARAFPGTVVDRANLALLWLADPGRADITLAQARATSFGIGDLRFVTGAGVRLAVGQAAGIVIALLAAFSTVALVAAGTMLAAGADADVRRRLPGIGVQRALGYGVGAIVRGHALRAARVAAPAAAAGLALGTLAVAGPSADLLAALNQLPPGRAVLVPLALAWAAIVALVCVAASWPAWRAARRSPAAILRGGDIAPGRRGAATGSASFALLGARFALARRGRFAAAVATVGACAGVVALMLALAALLERLRDDPGTLGRRYALTVSPGAASLDAIRAVPGVAGASPRWVLQAADSYRLGEPVRVIGYPGDHTDFEAPPLASGRRVAGPREAEVGAGLADALGLRPGSPLALQLPSGAEARFRVSGVVRALERDGRVAYVRAARLGAASPSSVVVRLDAGADRAEVAAGLAAIGAPAQAAAGAASRDGRFLGVLAAVLRGVGLAVGLVCLYGLVQAVALTARERRGAVALLRAAGAGGGAVAGVLGGAAAVVALPAAALGLALEALVLGPLVERLAAGFADLPLALTAGQAALVAGGLALLAAAATALVASRVLREPIVRGLREG